MDRSFVRGGREETPKKIRRASAKARSIRIFEAQFTPMKRLLNFFFQGLLFVVPIAVTLWVLFRAILWVDGLLPFQVPIHLPGKTEIDIPGLGLITIFLFIAAVGWLSARYIRNPLFSYLEQLIDKAPWSNSFTPP